MSGARPTTGSIAFGLVVGLLAAFLSYRWIADPERGAERQAEERVVMASRSQLQTRLGLTGVEWVDPLSPNRRVGKVYVYPSDSGWEVSGYYRRDAHDDWHPYLVQLGHDRQFVRARIRDDDKAVAARAAADAAIELLR